MAREYAIPSTSTIIEDFGLNVTPQPINRNRKVVILGSSEDGPMYEPISIDKPEDAELIWGRSTRGDLVRGIFECWGSQTGNPNVVGVRIGNGVKAKLDINESDSFGINEEQAPEATGAKAITLESIFPGAIYNQVNIKYDDRRNVAIFNPKTGLTTSISVDTANINNTTVDVHTTQELVDFINSNRNLRSVITATMNELTCDYEIKVNANSTGIKQDDNGIIINLKELLNVSGIIMSDTTAFMVSDPDLPYAIDETDPAHGNVMRNLTIANNLLTLDTIEAVSISEWEEIKSEGAIATLTLNPLDGKGTNRWDTIQCMYDYNGDSQYATAPDNATVKSEFVYHIDNVLTDEIPTDPNGVIYDGTYNHIKMSSPLPLDDNENVGGTGRALAYVTANSNYALYSDNYTMALCAGIEPKTINDEEFRPSGIIEAYVSSDVDPNGIWVRLPYDSQSGIYMSAYDTTEHKMIFSIGAAVSGNIATATNQLVNGVKFANMSLLVDNDGVIKQNKYVRIRGYTVKDFLTEVETLPQLQALNSTELTSYFVRGPEVVFNSVPKFPMVVNYGTRLVFEPNTNIAISDSFNGQLRFTDPDLLPGPAGGPLSTTYSFIRFKYSYQPNFPAITASVKNLNGGTNGTNMNVKQREDEFKKAYGYLQDYQANIWCPMSAFIDATKEQFSPDNGLKETVTSSYAADIVDFLDGLSINALQPHAVLGVTSPKDQTLGAKDEWVTKLTQVDINDGTLGANVMAGIQSKYISVCAFDPIFMNLGRGRPYASNGQAAYAGLIASLPYDLSPTNKSIPGVNTQRNDLSIRQYEALNSMRYVAMRSRPNKVPVIVNDITAAPYGSDFVSWSTYSITAEASDRIKSVAETYLGRPNSIELRNAMDQDIANVLQSMRGLQAYNFIITSTIEQQILGVVEIDVVLVPVFTMKKIRTTIKLRKNLPTT